MTDYGRAYETTPHSVLIKNLMNPNIPKTEMEHAACREIEMLREALRPPAQTLTCVCGAVWEGELMVHAPRDRLAQQDEEKNT